MTSGPGVQVVVPTYRRPERLERCLAALARQTVPVQVLVVDDGTPPPQDVEVGDVVARAVDGGLDVALHPRVNGGPAAARNTGAALVGQGLLAFTDDDCEPEPGWAAALVAAHTAAPDALLGGRAVNAVEGDLWAQASQDLLDALRDVSADHPQARFWASNNIACDASTFVEVGGFDEAFPAPAGEDRDLSERWAESGRPLLEVPDARVRHSHALTPATYWRMHATYGRGARQLELARRRRGVDPPLSVAPPDFYRRLLTHPFRVAPPTQALRRSALVAVSQAATAWGYATERRRPSTR